MKTKNISALITLIVITIFFIGCAANNEMYKSQAAGFWAGLWHGLICIITFIISLFLDNVGIYEVNNTGGWYDFGFVLGLIIGVGHGGIWNPMKKKIGSKCREEKEWEEIGKKVEEKVRRGIKNWVDDKEKKETDWEEIGKKIEEKIKRELKNWAEK